MLSVLFSQDLLDQTGTAVLRSCYYIDSDLSTCLIIQAQLRTTPDSHHLNKLECHPAGKSTAVNAKQLAKIWQAAERFDYALAITAKLIREAAHKDWKYFPVSAQAFPTKAAPKHRACGKILKQFVSTLTPLEISSLPLTPHWPRGHPNTPMWFHSLPVSNILSARTYWTACMTWLCVEQTCPLWSGEGAVYNNVNIWQA